MSDADNSKNLESMKPITVQTVQTAQPVLTSVAERDQAQATQIEAAVNSLLENTKTFPVRYQPSPALLSTATGRIALSIARAKFESNWDVKVISARLADENAPSTYWIIRPKKTVEPWKVRKDEDDDELDLKDLMSPLKF